MPESSSDAAAEPPHNKFIDTEFIRTWLDEARTFTRDYCDRFDVLGEYAASERWAQRTAKFCEQFEALAAQASLDLEAALRLYPSALALATAYAADGMLMQLKLMALEAASSRNST